MSTRHGASALEFALLLPVLVLLISGVADYGWYFSQSNQVAHAVREGARAGVMVDEDDDDPSGTAETRTVAVLEQAGIDCDADCTVTAEIGSTTSASVLSVTAVVTWHPLLGLVPVPGDINSALTMAFQDQF